MTPKRSFVSSDNTVRFRAWRLFCVAAYLALVNLWATSAANAEGEEAAAAPVVTAEGEQKPAEYTRPEDAVAPMGADWAAKQPALILPALPAELVQELEREDSFAKGRLRVGIARDFDQVATVTGAKSAPGQWAITADGWSVWAVRIAVPGAIGLRPHLDFLSLPAGARMLVYDGAKVPAQVIPFTSANLPAKTDLWLPTVFSDTVIVECQVPPGVAVDAVAFTLKQVSHLYRPLMAEIPKEGTCHNDVSCYGGWANQAAGVALMHFQEAGFSYACTGALLSDRDPYTYIDYFLTANHCIGDGPTASTLECYWFFQTSSCNGSIPSVNSVPRTYGADFLTGSSSSDGTLLRLREPAPNGSYYQGWTTAPASGSMTCIHHPDDAYKRISFGNLSSSSSTMWTVQWASGVTEHGSSGAPLYNAKHQIVGQLYGGPSSCSNPHGTDDYGRFDVSYQAFRPWIDAAPLVNDLCAGAITLAENAYYTETTSGAGNDATPCLGNIGRGVWFRWTSPVDGYATVDTCGTDFDTVLEVFSGSCGAFESLVCNDDSATCGYQAGTNWPCAEGVTYYICAGGFGGASGTLKIRVRSVPGTPALFGKTGMSTLNGNPGDAITLEPGATLSGSFPYFARNRQPGPGNYIVVLGLVNSLNQWVGGSEPQVIYSGTPSTGGESGFASWSGLTMPMLGGTYKMRYRAYPSSNPATCVAQFMASPPTLDSGNLQGLAATVTVLPVHPWILWWQNTAGVNAFWNMDGTNSCSYQQQRLNVPPASPGWKIVGTADFSGDGFDDLLWQNTNGWVAVWLLQGTNCLKQSRIGAAPAGPGWTVGATGDLDSDGQNDILFQSTSGATAVWFMNGTNVTRQVRLNAPPATTGWRMAAARDFDADGHVDLLWQHTTGATAIWFMNGLNWLSSARINAPAADPGWRIVGAASLFDSAHNDIIWQHQTGALAYWAIEGLNRFGAGRLNPPAVDPSWRAVGPK